MSQSKTFDSLLERYGVVMNDLEIAEALKRPAGKRGAAINQWLRVDGEIPTWKEGRSRVAHTWDVAAYIDKRGKNARKNAPRTGTDG